MKVKANSFDRMWSDCRVSYLDAVDRTGNSGWYVLGHEVQAFERDLTHFCGCETAVGCANGMDAIEIALRLCGIGDGDKVLTSPLSAFATGLAILRAGAEPVYCDVDINGALDPEAASQALEKFPDIRAIIPVHLYGHLADISRLSKLAKKQSVVLIEDAAQAIGAKRHQEIVGGRGHIACLSFYPTKNLGAIGDGGALLLPDPIMGKVAQSLRNYGQTGKYIHDVVGLNSRLDELHAATLRSVFLPRLSNWLTRRREIAAAYLSGIKTEYVQTIPGADPNGAGWHLFPVLVNSQRRESFLNHLEISGVQSGLHYPVLIPDQQAIIDRGEPLISDSLKNAYIFANGEVSLPIHPFMTDAEIEYVVEVVNLWRG